MDIGHFGLVLDTRSFFCRFVYLLSMDSQMTLTDPIITWNVTEEKPSYVLCEDWNKIPYSLFTLLQPDNETPTSII